MAKLREELTAAGTARDTLHEVAELSMIIQQFLLELACRSTCYSKEQIIDSAAELLLETITADRSPGSHPGSE